MAKYLLAITLISALSINYVTARIFWKRQAGDDPATDGAVAAAPDADASAPSTDGAPGTDAVAPGTDAIASGTDAVAPGTDAVAPGTDAVVPGTDAASPGTDTVAPGTDAVAPGTDAVAPGTDAVAPGTEPMTNLVSDAQNPTGPTGTEVAPDSSPQSEAPGSPSVTLDQGSTVQGETSGPLPEQISSEPVGTSESEAPGSIPPVPEQTAGMISESGEAATIQGSEPVLQPGSEPTSGVPGSEAVPVASVIPESETAVIVDAGTPAVVSELIPQVITLLQPIPVGTVQSGSGNPADTGVKGTVVSNLGSSTGGPVPTENADVFPFQGGFVFDSPFFNFAQIEDYFKKLEKAMEKIFRDTMKDVDNDSDLYKNTTERVVDVDGTRYKVHTTIIRGGDENNAVSIEAVSAIPESKRRKRSLF